MGLHCVSTVLPKPIVDERVGCESSKKRLPRLVESPNRSVQFELGVASEAVESLDAVEWLEYRSRLALECLARFVSELEQ